jgi:hypothetical protein
MRPTNRLDVTLARTPEVSRDSASLGHATVALDGPPALARGALGVLDLLGCDGLGDAGMHCSFLSIESCFSTAIRMN